MPGNTEFLNEIHPEFKKITRIMSMQGVAGLERTHVSPKITEKHIDKILEISEKDDERRYKDIQHSRLYNLIYILLGGGIFIFLTLFLVGKDPELFKELIKLLIAFVGGLGTGYGIKSYTGRK